MRRMVKLVSNADGEVSWQSAGATEDEIPPLITAKTICEAMLDVSANGHMLYLLFLRDAIRAKHPYHYRREENGLPVKWEHISKEIRTVIKRGHVGFIFDKHEVLNGRIVKDTNRKYGV
jgi:hypothetical protein